MYPPGVEHDERSVVTAADVDLAEVVVLLVDAGDEQGSHGIDDETTSSRPPAEHGSCGGVLVDMNGEIVPLWPEVRVGARARLNRQGRLAVIGRADGKSPTVRR